MDRRSVFVGNIHYDATEEEILEILREAGPVVSFRQVTDKDTGKPKGYGFCVYLDEETALSARRNLNGCPIRGRELRVAENNKGGGGANKNQPQLGAAPMQIQIPNPSPPQPMQIPNPRPPQPMQMPNLRPISQFQPEVEFALLQQVLSLPPEKLRLLSPGEQQQVIQLQQRYGSGSARSDSAGIICR